MTFIKYSEIIIRKNQFSTINKFNKPKCLYDYGIDSSLISVLIKLRDKIGKEVIDLIDSNFDLLPKKSAYIQVVAGKVQRNTPYYFALAYLNEPDSYASFMSIEEITQDEYFDYMADKNVFTKT